MAIENVDQPLSAFRIAGLPPDFYYIPNFISVEEEISVLQKVNQFYPTHHQILIHARYPHSDG